MSNDPRADELQEIYLKMDAEGRKKMVTAAAKLLDAQKTIENIQYIIRDDTRTVTQNEAGEVKININRKSGKSHLNGMQGYLVAGILLLLLACIFWVALINPALLMIGDSPLVMLRIITTALGGMFCIGTGLIQFILHKLTALSMLFSVGAGILCVEPGIMTDFIGLAIIIMIVAVKLIWGKERQTAMVK